MAGPYGGFDFEKTILAAKAGAEDRNIRIATQVVRNQQFNKEMTLRKSQLNERIRSNQAMEDYRDRSLMQADEHFDSSLGQRQHEFKEKHDLDERTHEYFKEINNRRQALDESKFKEGKRQFGKKFQLDVDRFEEAKKQFEIDTGYKYDVLSQDWNKFEDKLGEDMRQFDDSLSENQRQFNKTFKQRKHEFKKKYKLSDKQFKEVRKMNKFKRTMSKKEFEEAVRRFDETSEYKYDVLGQDMVKFDETMVQDLYKYNRSQGFNEYTFGRTQDFKEGMYEDQIARSTLDPNLMPSTGAPQDYGTDVGFLEGLARIGGGAGTGAAMGVGTGIAAAGPLGGIISPITAGGGAIVGGGIAALDLMFGSETADKGALTQAENYINEVESMVPMIADRPLNQAAISQQLTQMDQSLADAKQSAKVKKLRAKIASLENKVIIPGVYNTKSMLSK
jgi:hypothetical protein